MFKLDQLLLTAELPVQKFSNAVMIFAHCSAAKIDYELGKPVFEPLQSGDCIELRMYKLITAANLQSVFQT